MLASAVDMSQNDPTYPGPPVLGISHYGHHFIPRKAFHAATLLGYRRCFILDVSETNVPQADMSRQSIEGVMKSEHTSLILVDRFVWSM